MDSTTKLRPLAPNEFAPREAYDKSTDPLKVPYPAQTEESETVLVVNVDGLCLPTNPGGYACFGWIAVRGDKTIKTGKGCVAQGATATNNIAEHHALLAALRWLEKHARHVKDAGIVTVQIHSDSQLVVNQVKGAWAINKESLRDLASESVILIESLKCDFTITLGWVPREQNEAADALSREAYEEARKVVFE